MLFELSAVQEKYGGDASCKNFMCNLRKRFHVRGKQKLKQKQMPSDAGRCFSNIHQEI